MREALKTIAMVFIVASLGCGDDDESLSGGSCVPNQSSVCTCNDGNQGIKTCGEDGVWGECVGCEGGEAAVGGGGTGGVAGVGGVAGEGGVGPETGGTGGSDVQPDAATPDGGLPDAAGEDADEPDAPLVVVPCEQGLPTYVDLEVGHSTTYTTADGVVHTVALESQSLNEVTVSVDGVSSTFDLREDECGSLGQQILRDVNGVLVLPEVVSDIQNAVECDEIDRHRRWFKLKVGWEVGDRVADVDVEDPGFARLALFDPAWVLPVGVFPVDSTTPCQTLLDEAGLNLQPVGYGLHSGVDIWAPVGTPLVAPLAGTIYGLIDGCNAPGCEACGNYIGIDTGTLDYHYCHLDSFADSLFIGKTVEAGEYLGDVGTTGAYGDGSTYPHLHFAMSKHPWYETFEFNTYPYLDAWCREITCP